MTHEALLTRWRPVAEWLDRDRELLRYQSRVSAAASRWDREGRRSDLLLPEGKPLEEGTALLRSWGDELNATEREFIAQSRRRAQRTRRLKRGAVVALSVLTLLAVGLAVAAIREADTANRAADAANRARKAESVALEQAKDQQKGGMRETRPRHNGWRRRSRRRRRHARRGQAAEGCGPTHRLCRADEPGPARLG